MWAEFIESRGVLVTMSRRNLTAIVVGIFTVAVTLLIFFMNITEITEIDWTALFFIITAELIFFVGIVLIDILAEKSYGTMFRTGGFSTLVVYGITAIVISLFFIYLEIDRQKMLITIQLTILAVEIAILLIIASSAKSIFEKTSLISKDVADLYGLLDKIGMMMQEKNNIRYTDQLQIIYDAIKYSDTSVVVDSDNVLAKKIDDLQILLYAKDTSENDIKPLIERVTFLAQQRTRNVKSAKKVSI